MTESSNSSCNESKVSNLFRCDDFPEPALKSPLIFPHPEPKIPPFQNVVMRCARGAIGYQCKSLDRNFIHSRFCPVKTFQRGAGGVFIGAKFLRGDQNIIAGTRDGEIKIYNPHRLKRMFQTNGGRLTHLEPHKSGKFSLMSFYDSNWARLPRAPPNSSPMSSSLWNIREPVIKFTFAKEHYAEFSKVSQDKILASRVDRATIYDTNTGQSIMQLILTQKNHRSRNRATFSFLDNLVFCGGDLYDVASGKQVQKFNSLYGTSNGVFHPSRFEIVSGPEVRDIRTFRVLKTVPDLHNRTAIFSPDNCGIYSVPNFCEEDIGYIENPDWATNKCFNRCSSFLITLDSKDYSRIIALDLERKIVTLAVNSVDTQIVTVLSGVNCGSSARSIIRTYDVGRIIHDEDEQLQEDSDDDNDDAMSSGSSTEAWEDGRSFDESDG